MSKSSNKHSQCDIYSGARFVPEKAWHKTITYINAPAVGVIGKMMYRISINTAGMGEIQIDDFKEVFSVDFRYWTESQYEAHWLAASRALAEGRDVSFVQSMHLPEGANFYRIWAAYPRSGEVVFQEQILMLSEIGRPFNVQEPHFNALPYHSLSEDGEQVSEWRTKI